MYSATTSRRPFSLIPLIMASGKVFSLPTRTPTRFICMDFPFCEKQRNIRGQPYLVKPDSKSPEPRFVEEILVNVDSLQIRGSCYNPPLPSVWPESQGDSLVCIV